MIWVEKRCSRGDLIKPLLRNQSRSSGVQRAACVNYFRPRTKCYALCVFNRPVEITTAWDMFFGYSDLTTVAITVFENKWGIFSSL